MAGGADVFAGAVVMEATVGKVVVASNSSRFKASKVNAALTPWPGIGHEQRIALAGATATPISVLFGAAEITLPP